MNGKHHLLTGAYRRCVITYLSQQEKRKYEIAKELGLLEKVKQVGWAGLSAKETGRIGGVMGRRNNTSKGD